MVKNYISVTFQKLKSSQHIGRSAAHDRRQRLDGSRYRKENIDPTKSHLNRCLFGNDMSIPLTKQINLKLKNEIQRTIRKDAVRCIEAYAYASPAWFDEAKGNTEKFTARVEAWLEEKFGKNLIESHLHLDEKTPHIHAFITPITDDGRLHCRDFLFSPKKLAAAQDELAGAVQGLGLHRGERGSGAMHEPPVAPLKIHIAPPEAASLPMVNKAKYDRLVGRFGRLATAYKKAKSTANLVQVKLDQNRNLSNKNIQQTAELAELRPIAAQVRGIEVGRVVADWQAATDKMPPPSAAKARNAIDAVKALEGCDYKTAVQILAVNYGFEGAKKTAKEQAIQRINSDLPQMTMSCFKRPKWADMAAKKGEEKAVEELPAWRKLMMMGLLWPLSQVQSWPDPTPQLDDLLMARARAEAIYAWALRRACQLAEAAGVDMAQLDLAGCSPAEVREIATAALRHEGVSGKRVDELLPRYTDEEDRLHQEQLTANSRALLLSATGTAEGTAAAVQIIKVVEQAPQPTTPEAKSGPGPAPEPPKPLGA